MAGAANLAYKAAMSAACRILRLQITDFRSYAAADVSPRSDMVMLVGDNGAGKTNVLEALSLLAQGRGLRRADLSDMARHSGSGGFAIAVEAEGPLGVVQLGTGLVPGEPGRRARINRATVSSPTQFADHLRVVWLTPDQDGLFRGPPGDRRRFLDRLVLAVDPGHGARVSSLEKALRARNRLNEDTAPDPRWMDAIEREIAEIAVAVAAARRETVERLRSFIDLTGENDGAFPSAALSLAGDLETQLAEQSAGEAEDWYRAELAGGRARDRAAGRTLIGPHASDLQVHHAAKALPAGLCSTGEQKALLVGLILAHAQLVRDMTGMAPLVLLDEVAAHLDPGRRRALMTRLAELGGQVWMTGADPALLPDLPAQTARLRISPGRIDYVT